MRTAEMKMFFGGLWALALIMAGCGGEQAAQPSDASAPFEARDNHPRVETLVLAPDDFEDVIEITGAVEAIHDAVLSAEAAGTVEMIVPLGQFVSMGTVVARLDQGLAQAVLAQAEAALDNAAAASALAEDNFARMEPLYQDSIISALEFHETRARLQQARAGVRQAEATRSLAQEQLHNTLITAPFAGTVEEHRTVLGEQVAPGMPVARIVDTGRVKIAIGVPEPYAGDIEIGTAVALNFHALGREERTGRVTFAGNSINPRNRTFTIEAEVDNSNGRLKPEMIADVRISRQRLEDVLIVPRVAVVKGEEGNSVYVVDQSASPPVARRSPVKLGAMYAERVIVESGLEAGSEVIVLGHNQVTEGMSVDIAVQYHRLDAEGIPVPNGPPLQD